MYGRSTWPMDLKRSTASVGSPECALISAAGGKDLYEKANEKARWILENHQPDPLPESTLEEIRAIVQETATRLGV